MQLNLNKDLALILAPIGLGTGVFELFAEYSEAKIELLNDQLHRVDPSNTAEIGRIQGQIIELKALIGLKKDLNSVLKGPN